MIPLIYKIFKKYTNELIYKTETLTDLGTYSYQRGKWGERTDRLGV